ncbi:hypothetical protein [Paenibacillus oryzisoli]|uniref:Uncharacterized protein n=1 Tax=Paenibacillus oryzisoli TaxID=1850517 RepID=A0A198A8R4_9BACL|nr:hypothetical protein [Paenibacillus oryzisoli]OAS17461.1 hypothetical protein A8708_22100 [Paenibacillus oryzisoli]
MKHRIVLDRKINPSMNVLGAIVANQEHISDLPIYCHEPLLERYSHIRNLLLRLEGLNIEEILIVKELTLLLASQEQQSEPDTISDFFEYVFNLQIRSKEQKVSIYQLHMLENGGGVSGF